MAMRKKEKNGEAGHQEPVTCWFGSLSLRKCQHNTPWILTEANVFFVPVFCFAAPEDSLAYRWRTTLCPRARLNNVALVVVHHLEANVRRLRFHGVNSDLCFEKASLNTVSVSVLQGLAHLFLDFFLPPKSRIAHCYDHVFVSSNNKIHFDSLFVFFLFVLNNLFSECTFLGGMKGHPFCCLRRHSGNVW